MDKENKSEQIKENFKPRRKSISVGKILLFGLIAVDVITLPAVLVWRTTVDKDLYSYNKPKTASIRPVEGQEDYGEKFGKNLRSYLNHRIAKETGSEERTVSSIVAFSYKETGKNTFDAYITGYSGYNNERRLYTLAIYDLEKNTRQTPEWYMIVDLTMNILDVHETKLDYSDVDVVNQKSNKGRYYTSVDIFNNKLVSGYYFDDDRFFVFRDHVYTGELDLTSEIPEYVIDNYSSNPAYMYFLNDLNR